MKITIIGSGVMGQAMAQALLEKKVVLPQDLTMTNLNLEKLDQFKKEGVSLLTDNQVAIQGVEVVILAVKPQIMEEVLMPLKNSVAQKAVVISIAAGVLIQKIQSNLNHLAVVRVMPNTPLLVGKGLSGWFADLKVTEEQKQKVKQILNACGMEVEVKNEDEIDMITALSGSGPAYMFLFLQGLIEGAKSLGLDETSAKKAAIQTMLGGAILAENSTEDLQTLIEKVTSKGGTTEAALKKFKEINFKAGIQQAMEAAYKRAKELAKN